MCFPAEKSSSPSLEREGAGLDKVVLVTDSSAASTFHIHLSLELLLFANMQRGFVPDQSVPAFYDPGWIGMGKAAVR